MVDSWIRHEVGKHIWYEPLTSIHMKFWDDLFEVLHGGFYVWSSPTKYKIGRRLVSEIATRYWDLNFLNYTPQQWITMLNEILNLCRNYEVLSGINHEKYMQNFLVQLDEIILKELE